MEVKLILFKSNGHRRDLAITKPATIIGRSKKCDLRIPVISVSRRHCQLDMAASSLIVKDLGSSNGTYVNNKRVTQAALKAGDRLMIGPFVMTVQINGKPEQGVRPEPAEAVHAPAADQDKMATVLDEAGNESLFLSEAGKLDDTDMMDPLAALEAQDEEEQSKKP